MTDLRSLRPIWRTCGLIAAYLLLGLPGTMQAGGLTAPVWHPAAGFALFLLLRWGRQTLLPLLVACLLAAWLTPAYPGPGPSHFGLSLAAALLPLPGYALLAWLMGRHLPGSEFFASHRGLLLWTGAATAISLLSGVLQAGLLPGAVLTTSSWEDAVVHYAVAETAGMLAVLPLAWCLADPELRPGFSARILAWETAAWSAGIALVLWAALQRPATPSMAYYLLFLPLAWAAARQGMAGAIAAAIVLESAVTLAAMLPGPHTARIVDVQTLVLTLTLSGFLIGIAVDAARRASDELRQSLRLAAAGEMAAALAHELNQPLTALAAYGSACARLVARDGGDPLLQKTVHAIVAESQRASNVLKRLREFFRSGSTALERLPLADLVEAASAPFVRQAQSEGVDFQVGAIPAAILLADRVQLEIVLRNLLANAFQAVEQQPRLPAPRVRLEAGAEGGWIWIRIVDNGPGIANKIRARLFEPFISLKSSGLGLGLAISRAIVETHGGTLAVEPSPHGILRITLPAEAMDEENLLDGQ